MLVRRVGFARILLVIIEGCWLNLPLQILLLGNAAVRWRNARTSSLTASHRWNDTHLVAIFEGCFGTTEKANVFIIDI
jgi:hypothetical protein